MSLILSDIQGERRGGRVKAKWKEIQRHREIQRGGREGKGIAMASMIGWLITTLPG